MAQDMPVGAQDRMGDILAEFAEWHSICLMSLCKLKTTKN